MGKMASIALWAGCIIGSIVVFGTIAAMIRPNNAGTDQAATMHEIPSSLANIAPSSLEPGGRIAAAFKLVTDMTQLQVDQLERDIMGTVVQWRGPVNQVSETGSNIVLYVDETQQSVAFECWIANPTVADRDYAATIQRGQDVECRGMINRAATFGGLVLYPSLLVR